MQVLRMFSALVALGLFLAGTSPALAHERRNVGKYTFVVGFSVEPPIAYEPGGAQIRISETASNEPVVGVQTTLKVAVTAGGTTKEFALRAVGGTPGAYVADFIPTRAGQYQFRFFGDIRGDRIDERFESGPDRFNDVVEGGALQFPAVQAASADTATQVNQLTRQLSSLEQAIRDANEAATTGRSIGFAGAALGLIGLLIAGFSLLRGRKATASSAGPVAAREQRA